MRIAAGRPVMPSSGSCADALAAGDPSHEAPRTTHQPARDPVYAWRWARYDDALKDVPQHQSDENESGDQRK